MKIKYIAYDNREFNTEEECVEYEKKHNEVVSNIIMLYSDFTPTKYFDCARYLFIPNKLAYDYIYEKENLVDDVEIGWNIYDEDIKKFIPFYCFYIKAENKYNEAIKVRKELKKYN